MKPRLVLILMVLAMALAAPSTALANKQLYKARLSTGNELHQVVGSNASGSAVVTVRPSGLTIVMSVRGLSGTPTAAHIHAPATSAENAPPVVTLCGPAPSVFGACVLDASGNLVLQGDIPSTAIVGWTLGEFSGFLTNELTYVNVHTALNPAGEARGQLLGQ